MKNYIFIFSIFLNLLLLFSSKNQYYLTDYSFSSDYTKFFGTLAFKGEFNPKDYHYPWNKPESLKPIEKLKIEISVECSKYLHFYVTDANEERWEHPYSISEEFKAKIEQCSKTEQKTLGHFGLYISLEMEDPFYFTLKNPLTNEIIINTRGTDFLYTDMFIGFGGYLNSNNVFGFGERRHDLNLGDGKFTMWPNDTCGLPKDTGEGGHGTMGIHPLGFHKTKRNCFLGLLFNNINAQDLYIETLPIDSENNVLFEHRTIGGVIDYYMTINETPDEALISLHDIIGHPILPPFWALGFHQCRWGYHNTDEMRTVYESYIRHQLPFDTLWGDIDILQDYRIFTLNQENFRNLPMLINELKFKNYKFVPIVDLGFPINETDEYYMKGLELDAFIKSSYTNRDLISYVWPGKSVFPDFFNPDATYLWSIAMNQYYNKVKYDGIWLDMNEPAMIYVDDIERGELLPEGYTFDPSRNPFEDIPYVPGYRIDHPTIRGRTLSENCYSKLINENKFLYGYNFKPLIPYLQSKVTYEQLVAIRKTRPFVLSRSTSLGQGKYSFHWLGDNDSTYEFMRNGMNGIFQFQIYGIPFAGDDICGFNYDSTDTLCARWMSLGSFFPFARNHNSLGYRSQEPYSFGDHSLTLKSSKIALNMRYSLLRYYYSQLFKVSLGIKGAFFKPLFFEYPNERNTYKNVDESALIGDHLVIYPVFYDKEKDINVYLPKDDWYKFPSFEIFKYRSESGRTVSLSGKFENVNLFVRGRSIIPYQDTSSKFIPNTHALHDQKTELIIIPDSDYYTAEGQIVFDNDDYDTLERKDYYYIKMKLLGAVLKFEVVENMKSEYNHADIYISKFRFINMGYLLDKEYDALIIGNTDKEEMIIPIVFDVNLEVNVDVSEFNIKFSTITYAKFGKR